MPRKGESRRPELLQAAKSLLLERGYGAMSPRDVLDRSGAGQGSLYHHFSGKLDLALAALDEIAQEEIAAIDVIFAPDRPPLQRIQRYLRRERNGLRGCRLARLANEAAIELPEFRRPIAAYLDRITRHLRQNLEDAQAAGDLRSDLPSAALAATILAVVEGGYVLARMHWDPERMTQAIDGALALLCAVAAPARLASGSD